MVAASGTSGAGKAAKPHLLGTEVMGSASAYGVGGAHRHTPEIIQNLSRVTATARVTVSLHAAAGADAARHPRHLLGAAARRRRPRTRPTRRLRRRRTPTSRSCTCCPQGQWPQTKSVARLQRRARAGDRRRGAPAGWSRSAAVDNLAKGTGGAAVQCMNLALGLAETTGLTTIGVAP